MGPYRAVFFDFDGVLVDSEPVHWETWSTVLRPHGITMALEDYMRRFVGVSNREMIRTLCAEAGRPFDWDKFQAWYGEKKALYRERDLRVPEGLARFIREGLDGLCLGVVSSSQRVEVEPYLVKSGIRERMSVLVCAEDVERLKPWPDPYRKAGELAGVPAGECLAVEDSEAGERSAGSAGMEVLRVPRPEEVVQLLSDKIYYVK